jgi:hypothetical protein
MGSSHQKNENHEKEPVYQKIVFLSVIESTALGYRGGIHKRQFK